MDMTSVAMIDGEDTTPTDMCRNIDKDGVQELEDEEVNNDADEAPWHQGLR